MRIGRLSGETSRVTPGGAPGKGGGGDGSEMGSGFSKVWGGFSEMGGGYRGSLNQMIQ